ncbi:SPOR domain-containing protein [Qingshengfaniella alkalisoli]|nr:SPOR domain-containing protein [Qingshengfaniella alkalisoli]
MAYSEAFEEEPRPSFRGRGFFATLMGWAGAASSLALVGGLGWWATDLALRDARGVPVVRAMEGPARIAPENPGGFQADHQGLAVNNVASEGENEVQVDKLVLAPEPVGVADEDVAVAELGEMPDAEVMDPATQLAGSPQTVTEGDPGDNLDEQLAQVDEEPQEEQVASIDANEVTVPRPVARPSQRSQVSTQSAQPTSQPAQQSKSLDDIMRASVNSAIEEALGESGAGAEGEPQAALDTGDRMEMVTRASANVSQMETLRISAGTRLVQLGAFDSPEMAQAAWNNIAANFDTYVAGKQQVIEPAHSNGRTFYRLRVAGFDDLTSARNFCSVLLAEQADCIPVLTR